MRALALILTSFLVLAALQASYLVVESKRHQKQLARVHVPAPADEHHKPDTGPHNKLFTKPQQPVTVPGIDHKTKHVLPKKPMQKVKTFGHWNYENPDHKTPLLHKHHKKGHHKGHKKGHKHKDLLHNPLSPSHGQHHQRYKPHTEQPRYDQIKPAHDKSAHQMATKETIPGTQKPDVPTVNITIERVHVKNKHVVAQQVGSMHHMMMGDQPAETDTRKKADRKNKKNNNNQDREQKQKKNKRGKKKKKTENTCTSDTDCKEGQCCVDKKKGRKVCKKGHFKREGKRCLSSCICKSGLQCYVTDVNKKGKPRKKKPGKKIMGHCVNPSKVDLNKGHFVTPTANSTVTPTPTPQG